MSIVDEEDRPRHESCKWCGQSSGPLYHATVWDHPAKCKVGENIRRLESQISRLTDIIYAMRRGEEGLE